MGSLRESLVAELLTRARDLERYPFESATMAEAGRLAAEHLRDVANTLRSPGSSEGE